MLLAPLSISPLSSACCMVSFIQARLLVVFDL